MLRQRVASFASLLKFELPRLPSSAQRVRSARNLDDLRQLARARTPGFVFDYVEGGSYSESTVAWNRRVFDQQAFVPNVLGGVGAASTATSLFDRQFNMPIGIAPTGLTSLMRSDGELAGVRAAAARNVPFVLSTMGTYSIEDVARSAQDADRWFQLYLRRDRDSARELVRRANQTAYSTLVLTADTAVPGRRHRDERNGLSMPPKFTLRTAFSAATHPRWSLDFLSRDAPTMANFGAQDGSVSDLVGTMFDPDLSFDDVAWLRELWPGRLVVKGVLAPDDAVRLQSIGIDAVWVSNHGGRQLDRAITMLEAMPAIREAVGPNFTIIADSGILSGPDVVATIAAGADFTFIGRGYLYGLMAGGQTGVERALDLLQQETQNVMQLIGARTVDDIVTAHVANRSSQRH